MAKLPAAECPCCGLLIRRTWVMSHGKKVGMKFRSHPAPCGLPCRLESERLYPDEVTHVVTDECLQCQQRKLRLSATAPEYPYGIRQPKEKAVEYLHPLRPEFKPPVTPPEPKAPWSNIVIPPHALKMMKIRAGFESVVDAALMIERLYPLAVYNSSQKKAQGTSHTKRTKPGKNKHKSQRVDLYTVTDEGVEWIFYMKRNVLMTVHRNDEFDFGGPPLP